LSVLSEQAHFAHLNPYDSFHQCKRNPELLSRRINNLLKSISLDESTVKYHRGWDFYIQTPYDQIQQIGLIPSQNENGLNIELSMYFADTQSQAITTVRFRDPVNIDGFQYLMMGKWMNVEQEPVKWVFSQKA
jgi:hypothetical protein